MYGGSEVGLAAGLADLRANGLGANFGQVELGRGARRAGALVPPPLADENESPVLDELGQPPGRGPWRQSDQFRSLTNRKADGLPVAPPEYPNVLDELVRLLRNRQRPEWHTCIYTGWGHRSRSPAGAT